MLFERNSSSTNRNDAILYQIFAYLCFFRLDELQVGDFRKIVMSQEATKMHTFLQFAFNSDNLRENLREPWMEFYDYVYIDEKIIGGVEKNLPNISEIIKSVERRATGKITSTLSVATSEKDRESVMSGEHGRLRESKEEDLISEAGEPQHEKKITKIEPFNLTKPKPKLI